MAVNSTLSAGDGVCQRTTGVDLPAPQPDVSASGGFLTPSLDRPEHTF